MAIEAKMGNKKSDAYGLMDPLVSFYCKNKSSCIFICRQLSNYKSVEELQDKIQTRLCRKHKYTKSIKIRQTNTVQIRHKSGNCEDLGPPGSRNIDLFRLWTVFCRILILFV